MRHFTSDAAWDPCVKAVQVSPINITVSFLLQYDTLIYDNSLSVLRQPIVNIAGDDDTHTALEGLLSHFSIYDIDSSIKLPRLNILTMKRFYLMYNKFINTIRL